jgi:hypothetical protein
MGRGNKKRAYVLSAFSLFYSFFFLARTLDISAVPAFMLCHCVYKSFRFVVL